VKGRDRQRMRENKLTEGYSKQTKPSVWILLANAMQTAALQQTSIRTRAGCVTTQFICENVNLLSHEWKTARNYTQWPTVILLLLYLLLCFPRKCYISVTCKCGFHPAVMVKLQIACILFFIVCSLCFVCLCAQKRVAPEFQHVYRTLQLYNHFTLK
jgi:hypothetical protein